MMEVFAPAKINLTLEVVGLRSDGYHEVRSVIQTIGLGDRLRFEPAEAIEFRCASPGWHSQQSLVAKAADLLRRKAASRGAVITVEKRIPLLSGLGGDSSDAAAVLKGLNRLWGLGLAQGELSSLAAGLGSDVPFFLYGGTALVEGKGEIVTPLVSSPRRWVVLLVPPVPSQPGKTSRLYASLHREHSTGGQITERLVNQLGKGSDLAPSSLFNVFDAVAPDCFDGLASYRQDFLNAGAQWTHLAGSGPALFTLTPDRPPAEKIYYNLKGQGWESYLAETPASLDKKEGT